MKSDEFKNQFRKYRLDTLSEKEEKEIENELEKLDEYQMFLETEMGGSESFIEEKNYNLKTEREILKRSQFLAYFRMGIISLVVSLLVPPTLNFIVKVLDLIS